MGGCGEGRVKDKACGGVRKGTNFLGVGLGMGVTVGKSSFAIDWHRILHKTNCLGGGKMGSKGMGLGKRRRTGGAGNFRGQLGWGFLKAEPGCIGSGCTACLGHSFKANS